ncbi:arginase family protein [Anaeromyxobacter paludicola]|uniref:Agmatinase n=1 Tax=Anaeromyxobacter paludicola TaxID=2918171 RepID=A0ABN6NAQ3_9BACT|nr:arginase family protein [Anaeromyxobacter paludicola]BDG09430.1 agmatinase [Anaeromyxobacter paludicola]
MTPLEELHWLLRPAGGGLYLVSTGRAEQLALQRRLYRADRDDEVHDRWLEGLARLEEARAVILGIPSDVGAGYLRGANVGPQAIRERLLEERPDWPERARAAGVVDLGDVFVIPQLLDDEMLSAAQLDRSRRWLYPRLPEEARARLPVSPLSIAERALSLVLAVNPRAAVLALGGDHSCAWPVVKALSGAREGLGVVQVDAHTDLLEERLGVRYCYATWSYHANELLGRGGRLVQVGVRASGRLKAHWEEAYGVRQLWAAEVNADPAAALDRIVAELRGAGVRQVYFSNDVDGTDAAEVDATGTPEPAGLSSGFVVELVRRLGRDFTLCGGDVMEVAPPIARTPDGARRTVGLAVRYLEATLAAALGAPP